MKYISTLLYLGIFATSLSAQTPLSRADKEFNALAYQKAVDLYEILTREKELSEAERLSAHAKLAYSYRQLKDTENTERVFREMLGEYGKDLPEDYVICYLYFAQALASNGKYQESQEAYAKYSTLNEDDARGPRFSRLYKNISLLTKNVGSYKVDYLTLNSSASEFSPVYYKDGLVFVSNRNESLNIKRVFSWDETAFLDVYYLSDINKLKAKSSSSLGGSIEPTVARVNRKSLLGLDSYTPLSANDSRKVGFYAGSSYNTLLGYEERPLTEAERMDKGINSRYHEGPVTFSSDGTRVIFTRSNYNKGHYKVSNDGINKLKLYTSELINGKWENVRELSINSDEFSNGHPALNPDNSLLYFASDRPGGYGGTDLYVSRLVNNTWTKPVNMGPNINTNGDEIFPFIDSKGNLYFSSNGHQGLGDLDIFYAPLTSYNQAIKSINLGAPINSNKDDFGIITDAERSIGFFSSNRKNGGKDDDIYRFKREGPLYACRNLTVVVFDEETNEPLKNTLVQLENKTQPEALRQLRTDSTGNLLLCLAAENEFKFIASGDGYLNNTVGFSTSDFDDDHPTLIEIPLKKADIQASVELAKTSARGFLITQKNNEPLSEVTIRIKDDTDGQIQEVISQADGSFTFLAVPGSNYTLDAERKEYGTFGKKIISYDPDRPEEITFHMFEKGDLVRVENIYYDLDKTDIMPEAANELNKVVEILVKYPEMRIELGSHTDSRASARYNRLLSEKRARVAKEYMVTKGIDAKRLSTKGYGESKLTNECDEKRNCSEELHRKNRRTEIRIVNL